MRVSINILHRDLRVGRNRRNLLGNLRASIPQAFAIVCFLLILFGTNTATAQSTTYTYFACSADDNITRINATDSVTITKAWATPTDPGIIQFSTNLFDVCPQDQWRFTPGEREFQYHGTANILVKITSPTFNVDPPVHSTINLVFPVVFTDLTHIPLFTNPTATIFFFTDPSQTSTSVETFRYGLSTDFPFGSPGGVLIPGSITFLPGDQAPATGYADPAGLGPAHQCTAACGSPIDATTGNTYITADDLDIPGLGGGIHLGRIWNSLLPVSGSLPNSGMFGQGWRSTFEETLQQLDPSTLRYTRSDGSSWDFTFVSSSTGYVLSKPSDEHATIQYDAAAGRAIITFKDGATRSFDSANGLRLTSLADRNGNTTTLSYDAVSGKLVQVHAASGVVLGFQYANTQFPNLATTVTSAAGNVQYAYDANGNLTSATYADGSANNYAYDSNSLLTSVTDSIGHLIEGHTYDSFRRGLTSTRGSDADAIQLSYLGNSSVLITARGALTTFNHFSNNGRRYVSSASGPGCASCGAKSTTTYSYDSVGNPISMTDANGHIVAFTYDSQSNVLSRSAHLDDGTAQTWSYTYNQFSEVTSSTDPLGNLTSFQYDAKGNLLAVITSKP